MMRTIVRRLAKAVSALAIVAVAAVVLTAVVRNWQTMQRDQQEVARLTKEMKTVCVGRFLIDMPQEAQLGPLNLRVDGFDIESLSESKADFLLRLALREKRLKAEPRAPGGLDYLESVKEVRTENGLIGKIFVYGRAISKGTQVSWHEVERYSSLGIIVEAMVHGDGVSFEIGSGNYDPDLIEDMPKLISKLVPNPVNKAPTSPGFCFDRGCFRDPLTADQGEQMTVRGQLPSHPDIHFRLSLHAGMKPDEQGLLDRSAESYSQMPHAHKKRITRIRAAKRPIASLIGDEVVDEFDELNNIIVHSFWWELMGTESNVLIPRISLEMDTGNADNGQVSSSLSRGAAIALWDKISSSIRFHHPPPTATTRVVSPARPST